MTLTEFLTARLDEDEAAARAATAGPWRWGPARVLREVEAKRRIVDVADRWTYSEYPEDGHDILRAIASVYADHPDYDEAWQA